MPVSNTAQSYGSVARSLHWLTALLILTAIPLGLYANWLPYDTGEALAWKAQVFSVHKTLGVTVFFVALARIVWAIAQPRPAALHPERRLETWVAAAIHWTLYLSLVIVPLSGWVQHAASTGFAPILWPFGQSLPLVPKSDALAETMGTAHWVFTKVLAASVLLHIAGALKHHVFDRDATLMRMAAGREAPNNPEAVRHGVLPLLAALAIYASGAGLTVALAAVEAATEKTTLSAPPRLGNWQVSEGTIGFSVRQMGANIQGNFSWWSAIIEFDETTGTGTVHATIETSSLTLGSVTAQAIGPEFFDVAAHPNATYNAKIRPQGDSFVADGILNLRGQEQPLNLPFTLTIDGDTATMSGITTLDRRTFGMGASYSDEATVGFGVTVNVALTAKRIR